MLHAIVAAPLISPGLGTQDLDQQDKSIANFHLAANTDVTVQVSSKGLVYAPDSLHFRYFSPPFVCVSNQLSVVNFPAARTVLIKRCGLFRSKTGSSLQKAMKLLPSARQAAQRQAR
jgi:hypothetical protein